jgi:FtsH-binding integral membrane protein
MFPDANVRKVELEYSTEDRAVFNFFNTVYAWMAVGLAVTAVVGYGVSQTSALRVLYSSPFTIVALALAAFGIAWAVQGVAMRISAAAATGLFLLYAALIGVMISYIFVVYSTSTLLSAFVLTAGTFGGMSLYGFITKRDLTTIGSYLVMAFWGLLLASLVNIFLANNALSWVITYGVLFVFIGLTAYHTQNLKNFANEHAGNPNLAARMAIVGSLILYVAFINLFLSILRILGDRR